MARFMPAGRFGTAGGWERNLMPTRLIREGIIDSRAVNALSEPAEILYRRLMSVVDDYGRFEADGELIRARCFPRQLDRWKVERVEKYLVECSTVIHGETPCITVYLSGSRKYLQINNFGQRVQAKSKFPGPEDGTQDEPLTETPPFSTVDHGEKPSSRSRIRSRSRISNAESLGDSWPETAAPKTRGSRFSLDTIPAEWIEWCSSDLGWNTERAQSVFLTFADYWKSKAGAGARKVDWAGTWRNWCRREGQQPTGSTHRPAAQQSASSKPYIDPYQECPHCNALNHVNGSTGQLERRGCVHWVSNGKFDATRPAAGMRKPQGNEVAPYPSPAV
jgi:hypothetical protein